GRHLFHQLARAAVAADRQTTSQDLPEDRQVRVDAGDLLRAAGRKTEPADDLVENEERTVPRGELASRFEVTGARRDDAHVGRDRLEHERGDLARKPAEGVLQ